MVEIIIHLEPNQQGNNVFYAGQTLNGTVELSLNSTKKFRGCYVLVYSFARAHWTETRTRTEGTGNNQRTVSYTVDYEGKEVFLNSKTYLFGHHGGDAQDVQPGIHRYNFSCQLPEMLPYTMDGAHGNIGYYVECVIDVPWWFDKKFKVPFTVIRHDDLNLYPELRMGQRMEEIKTFCCLFCETGPLFMEVFLPCSGFVAGQSVPVKINYKNRSNVKVIGTNIKLKRAMHFTSHTPEQKTRTETDKIVELHTDGVNKYRTIELQQNLEIPRVMLNSNGRFCRIVHVEYYFNVEPVLDGCHSNFKIKIPIEIGSVPIRLSNEFNNFNTEPSGPHTQMMPSAPLDDDEKPDLPPTFEEAMNMPQSQYSTQPSNSNLGWNVIEPSLPNDNRKN
ncbi:hypothetical protein PVAND_006101 [Polypedilum vanderplanki]|uniref:Arrestin C-terminal-like domain-containing protein n=1 Tax=Polypedilum vanderplanki TaxID=319348 RepID=A0A9J6C245_POLVA|nr:hypothetical protein PVAND_006101 [Polypedilum vanderplanki]